MKKLLLLLLVSTSTFAQYHFDIGEKVIIQEMIWRSLLDGSGSYCQLQYLSEVTVKEVKESEVLVSYYSDRPEMVQSCKNGMTLSFQPHYLDTQRDYFHDYQSKKSAL